VIADMMLGRGSSARDREIIRAKIGTLARRGPGGWWRVAKNAVRVAQAGLVTGRRPAAPARQLAQRTTVSRAARR
jgi:hypothetical protein